jgi:hypothetical protein
MPGRRVRYVSREHLALGAPIPEDLPGSGYR